MDYRPFGFLEEYNRYCQVDWQWSAFESTVGWIRQLQYFGAECCSSHLCLEMMTPTRQPGVYGHGKNFSGKE
jgi:hypothetical protein